MPSHYFRGFHCCTATTKITAFEREPEHFVVTYGVSGKVVRIPISSVTAVGYQRAGGCCPWMCFDLSGETDCTENKQSVVIATNHAVTGVSKDTTVILDLVDPEKFVADNFGTLQPADSAGGAEMQAVNAEPQAVDGGNGLHAVVVPVST